MSMNDYLTAKALVESHGDKAHFAGPRPEALIVAAETALRLLFPPVYRQFLLDYGAGNFGKAEFYGAIDQDFEKSSVPDGIWYTLTERANAGLPVDLIVVGDTGTGDLYCITDR